jgi:hypothetical protein
MNFAHCSIFDEKSGKKCRYSVSLKGPKLEIFGSGVVTQIRPVWVGDLGTMPKNPTMGWFMPENRQFVLFSTVGYNAKDFLTL